MERTHDVSTCGHAQAIGQVGQAGRGATARPGLAPDEVDDMKRRLRQHDQMYATMQQQGKPFEALEHLEKGLFVRKELHGPDHPEVGKVCQVFTTSCNTLDFGAFGLKAVEPDRLTARQIEAARRALARGMKRAGRIWIRVFPDVPVSKKPAEVRMGSGKGSTEYWAARVKPGRVLFEIDGVPRSVAEESLSLAAAKLPIKTRFVARLGE